MLPDMRGGVALESYSDIEAIASIACSQTHAFQRSVVIDCRGVRSLTAHAHVTATSICCQSKDDGCTRIELHGTEELYLRVDCEYVSLSFYETGAAE